MQNKTILTFRADWRIMERKNYMEPTIHGTWDFPVAIYHNHFPAHAETLAPLHYHEEFEFLFVTEGCMVVQTEYDTFTLMAGEGIFINGNTLHKIMATDSAEGCGFLAVVFHYQLLCSGKDILFQKYMAPVLARELHVPPLLPKDFYHGMMNLHDLYVKKEFGMEIHVKQQLLFCMEKLIGEAVPMKANMPNPKGTMVKTVIKYIETHYSEGITLDDLCEEIHMSKEYLCRVFKEMSGISPIVYLNQYRIQQSRQLLMDSQFSITEIASRCGFNSTSYFNKLFLRYTGCTPKEYRRNPVK